MAHSIIRRHRERALAVTMAVGEAPSRAAATEHQLLCARLGVDLRRLHDIQSVERKIELKHELILAYVPWVQGKLAANAGGADEIVTHVMIWAFDIHDFALGLAIGEYVLRHKLPLPERFKRTAATLIVEEIADAALKRLGQGETFPLHVLEHAEELGEDEDMPDVVRAKLHKALALITILEAEALDPNADGPAGKRRAGIERALGMFRRAYGLHHGAGVKKDIDRLERELKKLAPPPEPDAA